jgi:hypothetical protein
MSETTERRCACGEAAWVNGRGFPVDHGDSSCRIGETWVQRSTFEKPPLELVKAYLVEKALANRNSENFEAAKQHASDLTEQLRLARTDAAEWRAAAKAQARIIARPDAGAVHWVEADRV